MVYFAFTLIGFSALASQVICIRELLISITGNELTLGIYFSNWLFASAVGSYIFAQRRFHEKEFPVLQIGTAVFFPVVLALIRLYRNILHILPGEGTDLTILFGVSLLLLGIPGFLSGAQFTAAFRLMSNKKGTDGGTRVYLLEALGSVAGGIATTFIMVTTFHNFLNVFFISFLNLVSASYFLIPHHRRWRLMIYLFVIPVGALVFVTISNILQTTTISAQWPDYEILEYQNSNYGNITLLQREQQLHLLNNGSPVAVAPNPDAAQNEIIAHVPLLMHQNPVHIMFIGNGISGILYEILKHPIQRVDYAEMDPLILDITRHYLPMYLVPDDKRLSIHKTDGRIFLKNATESYDIIYLNLPPPESLEINRFYTSEFFRLCKNRIKKSGVLVFVLPASESYFTEELGRMHQSILNAADEFFSENFVILNTSAIIFLSDSQDNLNHSVDFIIEQSKRRAIQTQTINNANLRFRLNPVYRQWYLQQIGYNDRNEKNSVFHPIAVFHSLLYWNAQHAPFLNKFFEVLRKIPISVLIISPIFLFLPVFILKKKSNQVLSVLLPIGLTGYAGMGTNVILVLLFQSLYGYIYQWIGLIATAFMLGISTGAFIIIKYSFHDNIRRIFFLSELAWISQIFFTLVFFYIMESGVMPETVFKIIILFLAGTAGILVGGQFPLAITILKSGMRDVRAAGITYAADLSGGWFGGITIAIYLIPLFGVWSTCLLLLILKLTSMSIVMHYRHTATGE